MNQYVVMININCCYQLELLLSINFNFTRLEISMYHQWYYHTQSWTKSFTATTI